MSVLVTMQVGPVDWSKFKAAMDAMMGEAAAGRQSSKVYRSQADPSVVLVVEEWDSHDAMHAYQDRVGDRFNSLAGTAGMDWDVHLWDPAGGM